jgi:MoaA/NifB/PqqE/SkfB family radical SAM enzyme
MQNMGERIDLKDGDDLRFGEGWHWPEPDVLFPFRWMGKESVLSISKERLASFAYLSFNLYSHFVDGSQVVTIESGGIELASLPVLHTWNLYELPIHEAIKTAAEGSSVSFRFTLNKIYPKKYYPQDGRELGIMASSFRLHNDSALHESVSAQYQNILLNLHEALEGKEIVSSYPSNLGIDLYGRCTMNPPCVYCHWETNKQNEGKFTDIVVDENTLSAYGGFFKFSKTLINCSIGEPMLHPRLRQILDAFERQGKFLELSTNGQALTERNISALAGKKIYLYVSLDAATKETYAKIRNDHFERVVQQLHALNRERKAKGNWPKLFMVFMPMRVNREDLEKYFILCREVDAEYLILRPLFHIGDAEIIKERGGYRFNYREEMLRPEEREEVFRQSVEYSKKYGVFVLNQFYFGQILENLPENVEQQEKALQAELGGAGKEEQGAEAEDSDLGVSRLPLCLEPWRNYYILRRGIIPCCYGSEPIASMDRFEEVWNSPKLQSIRRHLRERTFDDYCLQSLTCPIVQRHAKGLDERRKLPSSPPPPAGKLLRLINRMMFRIPGKIYHSIRG